MARFCTNCGKELTAEEAFCSECGTQIPKETEQPKETPTAPTPPVTEPTQPEPPVITPPPATTDTPPTVTPDPESAVVGTGMFFGLQLLFGLPLIGWLICLIMAFAPKNKNLKHYARATLIWILIGLVLSVALLFIGKWVSGLVMEYMTHSLIPGFDGLKEIGGLAEQFGGLEGIGELAEQFGDLEGISELAEQFGDLSEIAGQNGMDSGDLADILNQLPEGALEEILEGLPQQ